MGGGVEMGGEGWRRVGGGGGEEEVVRGVGTR